MRKQARRGKTSITIGWLLVLISIFGIIGLVAAVLETSPALGAGSTAAALSNGYTRYQETDPFLVFSGAWHSANSRSYAGGGEKLVSWSSGTMTLAFEGTSLTWLSSANPYAGIAKVTLDGGAGVLVDLYSTMFLNQRPVYTTGAVTEGRHTLTIQWTGKRNARSIGTYVYVDAIDVKGSLSSVTAGMTPTVAPSTSTTVGPTTATDLVNPLVDRGLVEKSVDPGDRRSFLVSLTAGGNRVLHRGQRHSQEHLSRIASLVTREEWEQVGEAMAVLGRALAMDEATVLDSTRGGWRRNGSPALLV